MQTTFPITSTIRTHPAGGSPKGKYHKRRGKSQESNPDTRTASKEFLRTVFKPISCTRLNPLFNDSNYRYLYESVKNYSHLLGSSFDLSPDEMDFLGLHSYFGKLLPEGQEARLTLGDKRELSYKVWFGYDFLEHDVYFIPVHLIDQTQGQLKEIVLAFFQHFQQQQHFPDFEELYDYDMLVNEYDCWYDPQESPEEYEYLSQYKDGYINKCLKSVYEKPRMSLTVLKNSIQKLERTCSQQDKALLAIISQGITILRMKKKSILYYACLPDDSDLEDEYGDIDYGGIMTAERMIRYVYQPNDIVAEAFLQYINSECGECGTSHEYYPRQSLTITPESTDLLEVDYTECFFSWLSELIHILHNYEHLSH